MDLFAYVCEGLVNARTVRWALLMHALPFACFSPLAILEALPQIDLRLTELIHYAIKHGLVQ